MEAYIITDGDCRTQLAEQLRDDVSRLLSANGFEAIVVELEREKTAPCLGCFRCMKSRMGRCVSSDAVGAIRERLALTSLTVYLTPVVFGHYSSAVKNAADRAGGSHAWQVVIGFGTDVDEEEKSTFIDLIEKHRGAADVVHPGMDQRVDAFVVRSPEEATAVCETLRQELAAGYGA